MRADMEELFYVLERFPQRWTIEDVQEIVLSEYSLDRHTLHFVVRLKSGHTVWLYVFDKHGDILGANAKIAFYVNPYVAPDYPDVEIDFKTLIDQLD